MAHAGLPLEFPGLMRHIAGGCQCCTMVKCDSRIKFDWRPGHVAGSSSECFRFSGATPRPSQVSKDFSQSPASRSNPTAFHAIRSAADFYTVEQPGSSLLDFSTSLSQRNLAGKALPV